MKTRKLSLEAGVWGALMLGMALSLVACEQQPQGLNIGQNAYQQQAQTVMTNMASTISGAKASTVGDPSSTSSTAWQPSMSEYNNPDLLLANCVRAINAYTPTPSNFRKRIVTLSQCSLAALQYRNPVLASLFRNATPAAQKAWNYNVSYSFPGAFNAFGSNNQLTSFMANGISGSR